MVYGPPLTAGPWREGGSILGRETAIQKIEWRDGWPYLAGGGNKPALKVLAPGLPERKWEEKPARDDFDSEELDIVCQTLRIPLGQDQMSLMERPGYLRLKVRDIEFTAPAEPCGQEAGAFLLYGHNLPGV